MASIEAHPFRAFSRAVLAAAVACVALPTVAQATARQLERPNTAAGAGSFPERPDVVVGAGFRIAGAAATRAWGGTYTTPSGERVTIFASDTYQQDETVNQDWANFLGSLVHGSELARVRVYLAPLEEVQAACGGGSTVYGCYDPLSEQLATIGDSSSGVEPALVLTHEYGHHVARNRVNPPWRADAFGTKRWASYLDICARWQAGQVFPGDEGANYTLNPGEAFAETYRLLNEERRGVTEHIWPVVERIFYPNSTALRLLEQDVVRPWTTASHSSVTGRFRRGGRPALFYRLATPLDGSLAVHLRGSNGTFALRLLDTRGKVLARTSAGISRTFRGTICGIRRLVVGVYRARGYGMFRVTETHP